MDQGASCPDEFEKTRECSLAVRPRAVGAKENVIPDEAIIKLNVRTFDEAVRSRVLAAIERIAAQKARAGWRKVWNALDRKRLRSWMP